MPRHISLAEARRLVDIGIITVKQEEFGAVLQRLPSQFQTRGKIQYNIASVTDCDGQLHHVAVVKSFEQGDLTAQAVAKETLKNSAVGVGIG